MTVSAMVPGRRYGRCVRSPKGAGYSQQSRRGEPSAASSNPLAWAKLVTAMARAFRKQSQRESLLGRCVALPFDRFAGPPGNSTARRYRSGSDERPDSCVRREDYKDRTATIPGRSLPYGRVNLILGRAEPSQFEPVSRRFGGGASKKTRDEAASTLL